MNHLVKLYEQINNPTLTVSDHELSPKWNTFYAPPPKKKTQKDYFHQHIIAPQSANSINTIPNDQEIKLK